MKDQTIANQFTIILEPTEEEMKVFEEGLENYNLSVTNGEFNSPQPWLSLILKDQDGTIVGGILTSTLYWTQYLEVLWVDEKYRGLGYGRDLVNEAHRLAKKQGCVSSHTYTFSWQAPDFYQAVGYDLIATYDGYAHGIKEYILMKRFDDLDEIPLGKDNLSRFAMVEDLSQESQNTVRRGLGSNFDKYASKVLKEYPHLGFNFIMKNPEGQIIGGMTGYTTMGTMYIDGFWIEESYRRQGHGRELLRYAEDLARERRCVAIQSTCFTFQNLEFCRKQGFDFYGYTDAYPNDVKEYFLIKRI